MKHLTYGKQITVGVVGIIAGHILTDLTDVGLFVNLGWIFYGLLFLLHPVWQTEADNVKNIKLYVRITAVVIILFGCMVRFGTGDNFWQRRISEALAADVSKGTVETSYDDHSGFHGDGTMYAVLHFEDEVLEQAISAPGGWNTLPLPENLTILVHGTRTDTASYGPYIGATVPQVEEGHYFFYDRKNESFSDDMVLQGGSFNYTFAMYDTANDLLYYYEYDS